MDKWHAEETDNGIKISSTDITKRIYNNTGNMRPRVWRMVIWRHSALEIMLGVLRQDNYELNVSERQDPRSTAGIGMTGTKFA